MTARFIPFEELLAGPTRNGLTRPKAQRGVGTKMVNMGELFAHQRIESISMDRVQVSEAEATKFLLEPGDLLFARQSLVLEGAGKCSIFVGDSEPVTFESHIIRARLDPTKADPYYYYYWFQCHEGRTAVYSIVEQGAGASGIRGSDLKQLSVRWVPLHRQQEIASKLNSFDDKIAVNRRMNETLEAMARAIFKSWFVDFDPVRAKAEGRQPQGIPAHIADLFPDSFQDSPLGLIPKGWEVVPLSDHVKARKGLSYKGKFLADQGMPLHNLNSVLEGGGYKYTGIKHYSGEYKPRHVVGPGDLIVTNTEQGFEHLLIGCPAIIPKRFGDKGLYSHHLYKIEPTKSSAVSNLFVCHLLMGHRMRCLITGFSNGTTVNMLPQDALEMPEFCLPPKPLIEAFTDMVRPYHDLQETNEDQQLTLARTRDTLLPKLLSGEVTV